MRFRTVMMGALLVGACASLQLQGGERAKTAPPNPLATFSVPSCRTLGPSGGKQGPGPDASYYLARDPGGAFVLYEMLPGGNGTKITNYWKDEGGHHFVLARRGRDAWHFVIPDNRTQPGMRLVHPQGTYSIVESGNTLRIQGRPAAECPMLQGGSPPPPPSTPPPEPTDTPVTVCSPGATQECIGAGACRGGQTCLPDGSGWGSCDCGPTSDGGADGGLEGGVDAGAASP